MPDTMIFDLYDERWHDCWIAATSVARARKKQIDFDIGQRVARLLEDYGPESEKPLTLRIYGTMIKGFCVINNERARALFSDCERVVLMFARQPFSEGDSKIRLPAAKRPRMQSALTLDLDLARVEASERFDWTQAPLEEGALLRLGGGILQEGLDPTLNLAGFGNLMGGTPPMLEPGAVSDAALAAAMAPDRSEVGWLPQLGEPAGEPTVMGPPPADQQPNLLSSQIVLAEPGLAGPVPPEAAAVAPSARSAAAAQSRALELLAMLQQRQQHRRHPKDSSVKPGVVYGFDDETMMPADDYQRWQQDASCLSEPRKRASAYGDEAGPELPEADHLGMHLRALVDPPLGSLAPPALAPVEAGLAPEAPWGGDGGLPMGEGKPEAAEVAPPSAGGDQLLPLPPEEAPRAPAASGADDAIQVPWPKQSAMLIEVADPAAANTEPAGGEARDDRTAEVGKIIRECLRGGGLSAAAFGDFVPPEGADRETAACTFAALLALATAGEFCVRQ